MGELVEGLDRCRCACIDVSGMRFDDSPIMLDGVVMVLTMIVGAGNVRGWRVEYFQPSNQGDGKVSQYVRFKSSETKLYYP